MTTIESAIDFIGELKTREIGFLTSDQYHLGEVLGIFQKLSRGEKLNGERKTLDQNLRHFRTAEELLGGGIHIDNRHLVSRMEGVLGKGNEVSPKEFYGTLRNVVKYIELVYACPDPY